MNGVEKQRNTSKLLPKPSKKYEKIMPILFIIGVISLVEGIVFMYSTINGWFSHIPIIAIYGMIVFGVLDILIIFIYNRDLPGSVYEKDADVSPYIVMIDKYVPLSNAAVSIGIGLFIVTFALTHYMIGIGTEKMGDADMIFIMLGSFLIIYSFIPKNYNLERDFILLFFFFLSIFMGILPFLFNYGGEGFKYYFLLLPLHHTLNLLGIENTIYPPATLRITDPSSMIKEDIIIAKACSGIYSFSIFISASIAFILGIYRKINLKSLLFIALAMLLAYIGNVLRMTIVTLSGYYYGRETLSWVHNTVGYPIFFIWMAFFWFILYHFLIKEKEETGDESEQTGQQ